MADGTPAPEKGAPSPRQQALDALRPLQPILTGFAHRNKNQHRRATTWWSKLGMLRRHLNKLIDELAAEEEEAAAAKSKSKKRKRNHDDNDGDGRASPSAVETRGRWLRDVLVPKCYLAFSQLTADNQFATLGIVILGSLAQVRSAIVQLLGDQDGEMEEVEEGSHKVAAAAASSLQKGEEVTVGADEMDMGQAVSRDEVSGRGGEAAPTAATMIMDRGLSQTRGKKKPAADNLGKSTGKATEAKQGKPAKKKKKRKGDEFDDLFKNLV